MNEEDLERLKSECNSAQFDFEEFRVSDIKQLINEIERMENYLNELGHNVYWR